MPHPLLNEFTRNLAAQADGVQRWRGGTRQSASLLEVASGGRKALLYVKASTSRRGFWGLTRNQVERLSDAPLDWHAVLLNASPHAGYLVPGVSIERRIANRTITLSPDGDYKINEPSDVEHSQRFTSLDQLVSRILNPPSA